MILTISYSCPEELETDHTDDSLDLPMQRKELWIVWGSSLCCRNRAKLVHLVHTSDRHVYLIDSHVQTWYSDYIHSEAQGCREMILQSFSRRLLYSARETHFLRSTAGERWQKSSLASQADRRTISVDPSHHRSPLWRLC